MVDISLINPIDQPTGRVRLLNELRSGVNDGRFNSLKAVVAFAKSGPLLRLHSAITVRRALGFRVEAVIGVDQLGTSAQALKFALENFDGIYFTREPGRTFHPKIYIFEGASHARVFVGSNNLTVGGTETNFETSIRLDFSLPSEASALTPFTNLWDELMPSSCPATTVLTTAILENLVADGTVPDERAMRTSVATSGAGGTTAPTPPRSGLPVLPPSALPPKKKKPAKAAAGTSSAPPAVPSPVSLPTVPQSSSAAQALAIQIKPHNNGEIFLSVTAALQYPSFFRFPFNGQTTPKIPGNPSYPQLTPDPVVNIAVFGAASTPILTLNAYPLNTVYYEKKSEIRITASPLVGVVPDYSVMVMAKSSTPGIDYEITIHTPTSPDYAAWVATCNQQMPGGGSLPRKFGWL
ncbi:phospholipase D family protein [Sinorhizobium meliloti]|uniref:phospholipase D family protein n=1 Tax=Rhizobium meliloti TaxID=382 RepID=UPI0009B92722|nr:phospholipase D family protein [Sinorhizobium meliloti]